MNEVGVSHVNIWERGEELLGRRNSENIDLRARTCKAFLRNT